MTYLQKHYFAYGSNLGLQQMATRCPNSIFIGRAVLRDYRFQINERGFANVVPETGNQVEGLLYLLDEKDEKQLDRNEGVPRAYQKQTLDIEVWMGSPYLVGRKIPEVVANNLPDTPEVVNYYHGASTQHYAHQQSGPNGSSSTVVNVFDEFGQIITKELKEVHHRGFSTFVPASSNGNFGYSSTQRITMSALPPLSQAPGVHMRALVYVSQNYTNSGEPRKEYIKRMNNGILDAFKLGVTRDYIELVLRKHIPVWVENDGGTPIIVDAQMRDGPETGANQRKKGPIQGRRDVENTGKSSRGGVVRTLPKRNKPHITGATERAGLQSVGR